MKVQNIINLIFDGKKPLELNSMEDVDKNLLEVRATLKEVLYNSEQQLLNTLYQNITTKPESYLTEEEYESVKDDNEAYDKLYFEKMYGKTKER